MIHKNLLYLFFLILMVVLLIGCGSSSTPVPTNTPIPTDTPVPVTVIDLPIDEYKISLEFLQNDTKIPVSGNQSHWKTTLRPYPFTLMVNGDEKIVSILAFKDADNFRSLKNSTRPLAIFEGTSYSFYDNNLRTIDEPLEIHEGNHSFFTDQWNTSPEDATEYASFLEEEIGSTPNILLSGRAYPDHKDEATNFSISTVDGDKIQDGESILLVVFVEKELGQSFKQVNWLEIDIDFQKN